LPQHDHPNDSEVCLLSHAGTTSQCDSWKRAIEIHSRLAFSEAKSLEQWVNALRLRWMALKGCGTKAADEDQGLHWLINELRASAMDLE